MTYLDFLANLEPFIKKNIWDYFANGFIAFLVICLLTMPLIIYGTFKEFTKTKALSSLFALFAYIGVSVMGCFAVYGMITAPSNTILRTIKQVKLDNKENIEFYKTIIRNPYYQKMDDSDKTAVYVLAFNGIVCADEGCLSNTGEPLLLHKNYALTYAIEKTLSAESVKLNKDFGKVTTLSDVAYKGLDGLSYNGISYEYEKAFKEFLEKTPKAVETIENAKQAYKNLEATYGSEWK